jgi:tetratricopeptide (TPR) repeat protein
VQYIEHLKEFFIQIRENMINLRYKGYYKIIAILSCVALMVSVYVLQRQIDNVKHTTLSERLLFYLPPGGYVKSATLGFDAVVADLLWAYTVVSFGEDFVKSRNYKWLHRPLDVITTLDPLFEEVYRYGGILLSIQTQQVDKSIVLLEKGIKKFPDDWRLYFILGFNYTYYKNDDVKAVRYFEKANSLPGHPTYLPRLIGNLYAKMAKTEEVSPEEKIDLAIKFLEEAYEQFKDEKMRAEIVSKIKELLVEKHTKFLEKVAKSYKEIYGKYPDPLEDLIRAGFIKAMPIEPHGGRYVIDPRTGEVKNTNGK